VLFCAKDEILLRFLQELGPRSALRLQSSQKATTNSHQPARSCDIPFSLQVGCFPPQELGPRFALRLQSLQKGTFDSKGGEFEWETAKKDKTATRRRFNL